MQLQTKAAPEAYLGADAFIESDHPEIVRCAQRFTRIEDAYHFVRDEIAHSWDCQATDITRTASEVLAAGHGICYAKAHLLAALLRAMGVPTGLAYQRLVLFDDPKDGYSLHGMNTVYLADEARWVRLDARGNKPGVAAEFSREEERLAFPLRGEYGECDYPWNFATPPREIQRFYEQSGDARELYTHGLPDCIVTGNDQ